MGSSPVSAGKYLFKVNRKSTRITSLDFEQVFAHRVNPYHASVVFHIESSHLICDAKQMTGFYIKCNTGLKWLDIERDIYIYAPNRWFLKSKHQVGE